MRYRIALAGAGALALWAVPAAAQQQAACGNRADMLAAFARAHQEVPASRGLASKGHITEIWRKADGSTWSIVISDTNGRACMVDEGSDWQDLVVAPPPEGIEQ